MTGETGAGKSVLLHAIALLCGRRTPSDAIRTGASSGSAEAIIDAPVLLERARGLGLAEDEDAELLVSRRISRDGRGKVFVNGRLATVTLLQQLLGDSLEIVSQGGHQRLLRPSDQGELLDRYGDLGAQVAKAVVSSLLELKNLFHAPSATGWAVVVHAVKPSLVIKSKIVHVADTA